MANRRRKEAQSKNTGKVVLGALKKLMRNTGWTTRTIVKFIKMEYEIQDKNLGRKVARALKRGVKLGLLQIQSGRYRLSNMSGLVQLVSSTQLAARRLPRIIKKTKTKTKKSKGKYKRRECQVVIRSRSPSPGCSRR